MRSAVAIGRLGVAGLLAVALAVSAAMGSASRDGMPDFLAYFATQSSLIAIAAWTLSAAFLLARGPAPAWVHVLRGAAVSYAIVLAACRPLIALPWQPSSGYPIPAVNVFITLLAPALLAADWVFIGDRRPLSPSFLRWVAAYPVLWSTLTLLRGMDTGWAPYPLLNPVTAGPRLPLYLGAISLSALAAGALTSWMSRRRPLLPMDPAARAVETGPTPVLPPLDLPSPSEVLPPSVAPLLRPAPEPAAPLQAFAFVEPPEAEPVPAESPATDATEPPEPATAAGPAEDALRPER
jgi:hypothetical protein